MVENRNKEEVKLEKKKMELLRKIHPSSFGGVLLPLVGPGRHSTSTPPKKTAKEGDQKERDSNQIKRDERPVFIPPVQAILKEKVNRYKSNFVRLQKLHPQA